MGGTPGVATYGWLLYRKGALVCHKHGVVCRGRFANSLMAESAAMASALRWAIRSVLPKGSTVIVQSDCLSLVEHLNGIAGIRRKRGVIMLLRAVFRAAARLRRRGVKVEFRHVARSTVAKADALCWRAYNHPRKPGQHITGFLRANRTR